MEQTALIVGGGAAGIGFLMLVVLYIKRQNISGFGMFRGVVAFGLLFLFGLYFLAIGVKLAPTPRELGEMFDSGKLRPPAESMSDDLAVQIVEELKSEREGVLMVAMEDLARLPPDGIAETNRKNVETELLRGLSDDRRTVQLAAANALAAWGSADSTAGLAAFASGDGEIYARRACVAALAKLQDPGAIESLVGLIPGDSDRVVIEAVVKFGPAAEPHALKLLDSDDPETLEAAFELLTRTGTEQCLPPLDEIASGESDAKEQTQTAAAAIRSRLGL